MVFPEVNEPYFLSELKQLLQEPTFWQQIVSKPDILTRVEDILDSRNNLGDVSDVVKSRENLNLGKLATEDSISINDIDDISKNYLQESNNLSDVDSISKSRSNLKLGSSNRPTFAGVNLELNDTNNTQITRPPYDSESSRKTILKTKDDDIHIGESSTFNTTYQSNLKVFGDATVSGVLNVKKEGSKSFNPDDFDLRTWNFFNENNFYLKGKFYDNNGNRILKPLEDDITSLQNNKVDDSTFDTSISNLQSQIDSNDQDITNINENVENLASSTNAGLSSLYDIYSSLGELSKYDSIGIDPLIDRVSTNENDISNIDTSISNLDDIAFEGLNVSKPLNLKNNTDLSLNYNNTQFDISNDNLEIIEENLQGVRFPSLKDKPQLKNPLEKTAQQIEAYDTTDYIKCMLYDGQYTNMDSGDDNAYILNSKNTTQYIDATIDSNDVLTLSSKERTSYIGIKCEYDVKVRNNTNKVDYGIIIMYLEQDRMKYVDGSNDELDKKIKYPLAFFDFPDGKINTIRRSGSDTAYINNDEWTYDETLSDPSTQPSHPYYLTDPVLRFGTYEKKETIKNEFGESIGFLEKIEDFF